MKITNVQRAFLEGVKYGYRIAAEETRCDVEDLVEELKDANAEVRAELTSVRNERARCHAIKSACNAERDPETRLN